MGTGTGTGPDGDGAASPGAASLLARVVRKSSMEYVSLGQTGIRVSKVGLGVLTMGPLQADLPLERGAYLIRRALAMGINLFDTAQLYRTYPHLREGLRRVPDGGAVLISKAYAHARDGMSAALAEAEAETGRRIDIFMLHEQESVHTLAGHRPALEYLVEARAEGRIGAVGLSTHRVAGVRAGTIDPRIQVIMAIVNLRGLGIGDGTAAEMLEAVGEARKAGKGVIAMKLLGGGALTGAGNDPAAARNALLFARERSGADAFLLGAKSVAELSFGRRVLLGLPAGTGLAERLSRVPKRLHVDEWCNGCGECLAACGSGALRLVEGRAKAGEGCVLCGYCVARCPDFYLKML